MNITRPNKLPDDETRAAHASPAHEPRTNGAAAKDDEGFRAVMDATPAELPQAPQPARSGPRRRGSSPPATDPRGSAFQPLVAKAAIDLAYGLLCAADPALAGDPASLRDTSGDVAATGPSGPVATGIEEPGESAANALGQGASADVVAASGSEMRGPESDPTAVQPSGGHPTAVQPRGGHPTAAQPSGGHPTAAQPSGGHPTAAQPSGGHPTAAQPSGGHPTAAQPSGGDPTAAQPSGGHPTAAQPSGGDPTAAQPSGGDPTAVPPSGSDPTGAQPSGGDLTAAQRSGAAAPATRGGPQGPSSPRPVDSTPSAVATSNAGPPAPAALTAIASPDKRLHPASPQGSGAHGISPSATTHDVRSPRDAGAGDAGGPSNKQGGGRPGTNDRPDADIVDGVPVAIKGAQAVPGVDVSLQPAPQGDKGLTAVKPMSAVAAPAGADTSGAAATSVRSAHNQQIIRNAAHGEFEHPELGHVAVSARLRDGEVDVRVTALRPETAAFLTPHAGAMAADARAANVPIARVDVDHKGGASSASSARSGEGSGHHADSNGHQEGDGDGKDVVVPGPRRVRIVL
jgi:hypothetical protein